MEKKNDSRLLDILTTILVVLACMSPRYIATLKIRIGINFSYFDFLMIGSWLLFWDKKIRFRYEYFFGFWLLIQILLSFWRAEQVNYWAYYVLYVSVMIMFMLFIESYDAVHIYDSVAKGFVIGLLIHLMIGLFEITFKRYPFAVGDFSPKYMYKTGISIFHNPNDYSMFIIVLFPLAVSYLAGSFGKSIMTVFYGAVCAGCVYFAIINQSRIAVLSLFLLGAYYFWHTVKNSRYRALISLLTASAALLLLFVPQVSDWLLAVIQDNSIDTSSRADIVRINLIKNGLHFLEETYGFGVGAGNMHYWLSNRTVYFIENIRYMHNWYVELLATFGIATFILYMVFHGRILWNLYKRSLEENDPFGPASALLLSFIVFSVASISSSTNVYSEWIWAYLGWMAVISGSAVWGSDDSDEDDDDYFSDDDFSDEDVISGTLQSKTAEG